MVVVSNSIYTRSVYVSVYEPKASSRNPKRVKSKIQGEKSYYLLYCWKRYGKSVKLTSPRWFYPSVSIPELKRIIYCWPKTTLILLIGRRGIRTPETLFFVPNDCPAAGSTFAPSTYVVITRYLTKSFLLTEKLIFITGDNPTGIT
jgi:hypothetical protein